MSGLGFGQSRNVRVGEIVELRVPLDEGGQRRWRLASYDSRYLRVAQAPQVQQLADGSLAVVFRARASLPGKTEVELSEVGEDGRRVRFTVRIRE
jgi:hypothetical protein